jgi:hypothetical protein
MSRVHITESPWYWLMAFAMMAVAVLLVIDRKYGERQAELERQYQAREWVSESGAAIDGGNAAPVDAPDFPDYATPDRLIIPLWPLAVAMGGVAVFAWLMLARERSKSAAANQSAAADAASDAEMPRP